MTAYKLTCPESETGEHEWKHHQCTRCGLAFDSPYECEFANAAAREIKRLKAEMLILSDDNELLRRRLATANNRADDAESQNESLRAETVLLREALRQEMEPKEPF